MSKQNLAAVNETLALLRERFPEVFTQHQPLQIGIGKELLLVADEFRYCPHTYSKGREILDEQSTLPLATGATWRYAGELRGGTSSTGQRRTSSSRYRHDEGSKKKRGFSVKLSRMRYLMSVASQSTNVQKTR